MFFFFFFFFCAGTSFSLRIADDGARFTADPAVRDEDPFQKIAVHRDPFRVEENPLKIVDEHLFPDADAGLLPRHIKQEGLGCKVPVRNEEKGRCQGHQKGGQGGAGDRKRQLIEADAGHLQDGPFIVP